jgi:hypothetical protein
MLHLRCDDAKRPVLDGPATYLYLCVANRCLTEDEDSDPPKNVHLGCKEIGRLYYLVSKGERTLRYLTAGWPHVFNSEGMVWEHRLPMAREREQLV